MGLSASLICFILISIWVSDELSYDKFNKNYARIFRLTGTEKTQSGSIESAVSSAPMANALKNDYPEVEQSVRLKIREEIIENKGIQYLQPNILLTDPSFFNIFSYGPIKADLKSAFNEPFSVILTESAAKKFFGNADPIGQFLKLYMYDSTNNGVLYNIIGVIADPPKNSHFTFSMLVSFKTIEVTHPEVLTTDGWGDQSFYTYLLLKKGTNSVNFSRKIAHFYKNYVGDLARIWEPIYSYYLQPIRDIHLRSHLKHEIAATGNINDIYIFSTIGIIILLLAAINYINLATARSATRAKEVSIKKVVGADKGQLIFQYLLESVITALLALIISLVGALLLQPYFSELAGKDLSVLSSWSLLLFLFSITIVLGMLAGIYPALLLTRFKPALVLKGAFKSGKKGVLLRKMLVVIQFVITISLISGIIIIYFQMNFIQHKELGYDKDQLLFMKVNGNTEVIKGYASLKNDLQRNTMIKGICTSNSLIVNGLSNGGAETLDSKGFPMQVTTSRLRVDSNYFSVYGIKLIAGNNFTHENINNGAQQVILNESAVKKFGWKNAESAIGKPFKMGDQNGVVIGVTSDFHFNSLQEGIEPLVMYPVDDRFSRISLKFDSRRTSRLITFVEKTWKKHFPSALFDYDFVSNQIKQQYLSEERFSKVFFYFCILSLLIACLGLYGLIAYTISQKTKEIGIRKVLGATVLGIASMLSASFLRLVALAGLISIPLSWYLMNRWLEDFAYRIHISWWMFFSAAISVLVIAIITVGIKSLRAAFINPIQSLRTE